MTPKMNYVKALAEHTAEEITRSRESWTSSLMVSARLYKYSYPDQLLIFAQRPNATACAEYDFWNDSMNRYVKRGSKGIALIDVSRERPRLRYEKIRGHELHQRLSTCGGWKGIMRL